MSSETDFTQEKAIFMQLLGSQLFLTVCCCSVTKWSDGGIVEAQRAEKNAFLKPLKMCFRYQRIKFPWKKWVKIFKFAYG